MPKIVLLNTQSGKLEDFEPVDAREALAGKNTIYQVPAPEENKDAKLTMIMGNTSSNAMETAVALASGAPPETVVNIPQLQGGDAEMQTGLSIEKYGRSNVVQAQPGNPVYVPIGEDTTDPKFADRAATGAGRSTPGASGDLKTELKAAERRVEDLKDQESAQRASGQHATVTGTAPETGGDAGGRKGDGGKSDGGRKR